MGMRVDIGQDPDVLAFVSLRMDHARGVVDMSDPPAWKEDAHGVKRCEDVTRRPVHLHVPQWFLSPRCSWPEDWVRNLPRGLTLRMALLDRTSGAWQCEHVAVASAILDQPAGHTHLHLYGQPWHVPQRLVNSWLAAVAVCLDGAVCTNRNFAAWLPLDWPGELFNLVACIGERALVAARAGGHGRV